MTKTQKKLEIEYDSILRRLHAEAIKDACKGDIFVGWDWPTLAIVKPTVYARLKQIELEYKAGNVVITQ